MSDRPNIQALFREGVEEARLGNREAARALFEKVVAFDPQYEKGWLWLASVTDDSQDQQTYLRRVLELNPNNERAQRALAKAQARRQTLEETEEAMPGVSRRSMTLLAGAGILALIAVIAVIVVLVAGNNRRAQEAQAAQAAAIALTVTEQQAHIAATATAEAVLSLTPALTETPRRTPIPTWTPTPTETPATSAVAALPTPAGLEGRIAGRSGRDIMNAGFLPVGYYDLSNGAFTPVGGALGRDVRVQPSGQRLIYTRYDQGMFTNIIESVNLNGSDPRNLAERWQGHASLLDAEMPSYSPDGNRVAFIATGPDTRTPQVFMVNLGELPDGASPLRQLTNDSATYSEPAISPDGRQIAVVRNDLAGPTPGADIVIIDIETLQQRPLTSDYGTFTESSPAWSPDGFQIAYAAAAANDPQNNDIAIRASAGYGVPTVVARDPANEVSPVFSPDGSQLAFAGNRGGQYDIYILDLTTQALWQLTNTPEEDYPGGWWQTVS